MTVLNDEPTFDIAEKGERLRLVAGGAWTTDHADRLEQLVAAAGTDVPGTRNAIVDVAGIDRIDTFGAWLIERTVRRFQEAGAAAQLSQVPDRFAGMFDRIHAVNRDAPPAPPGRGGVIGWLNGIGGGSSDGGMRPLRGMHRRKIQAPVSVCCLISSAIGCKRSAGRAPTRL